MGKWFVEFFLVFVGYTAAYTLTLGFIYPVQKIVMPENYYPENNIKNLPTNIWRPFAFLLFANWLNQLYQKTPYDLSTLKNRNI